MHKQQAIPYKARGHICPSAATVGSHDPFSIGGIQGQAHDPEHPQMTAYKGRRTTLSIHR